MIREVTLKEDDGRGILLRRKSEEDTSMNTSFQLRKSLVLTFIVVISLMTYFFNLSVGHDELESAVGAGVAAASSLIGFFLVWLVLRNEAKPRPPPIYAARIGVADTRSSPTKKDVSS